MQNETKQQVQLWEYLEVGVMVFGREDGLLRFVNRRACKDLQKDAAHMHNAHYKSLFLPEFAATYETMVAKCRGEEDHTFTYYWALRTIWEQVSIRAIYWNEEPAILISVTNVTKLAYSGYKYEYLAYFDPLLRLPNGQKLEEDINAMANVETVSLLYFEMDRYAGINALYGWDVGDQLLVSIKDWLLESETRQAQVYRINNGFALLGRRVSMEDAQCRAEEIIERFRHPWAVPTIAPEFSIYLSIRTGIVFGKYVKNEMRNLLLRTTRASKTPQGYAVYDDSTDQAAQKQLLLQETLIHCMLENMKGFEVHYQPIVSAQTREPYGVESLCRWSTPQGERIAPDVFIRIAERVGMISQLDNWVRRTAMEQCAAMGFDQRQLFLDVNFSPVQKVDAAFCKALIRELQETGFPTGLLNLEITESAQMRFDEETLDGLRRLKQTGIGMSLDDFGTGYSSFENLIKISADALKIDKLFIDEIEQDSYKQYLLGVMVGIAHHLGMYLIAEGVETEDQYELLKHFRVDYMQGYLFSRPLPAASLAAYL